MQRCPHTGSHCTPHSEALGTPCAALVQHSPLAADRAGLARGLAAAAQGVAKKQASAASSCRVACCDMPCRARCGCCCRCGGLPADGLAAALGHDAGVLARCAAALLIQGAGLVLCGTDAGCGIRAPNGRSGLRVGQPRHSGSSPQPQRLATASGACRSKPCQTRECHPGPRRANAGCPLCSTCHAPARPHHPPLLHARHEVSEEPAPLARQR